MKRGICPKCGSKAIYKNERWLGEYRTMMQLGWLSQAKLADYICVECGFIESYLARPKDARKVARRCTRVSVEDG